MSKVIFNDETLSFEKAKFSLLNFLKTFLPHFLLTLTLGTTIGYILYNTSETPQQKKLKKEYNILVGKLNLLNSNLNYLSDRMSTLEDRDDYTYRNALFMDPIPKTKRMLGYGGSIENSNFSYLPHSDLLKEISRKNKNLNNRIKLEIQSYKKLVSQISKRDLKYKSTPSIWPIPKKDLKYISSPFGYRMHPILHVIKMHTGIDLCANIGTPVYATADGIVLTASYTAGGYGKHIVISHGPGGYITFYAHLSKILVAQGQKVHRGQLIGKTGNTGRSTGPHLHYEIRLNNKPINPKDFLYDDLTDKQYQQLVTNQPADGTKTASDMY